MNIAKILAASALCLGAVGCRTARQPLGGRPVDDLNPPLPVMRFSGKFTPVANTRSGSAMTSGTIRINGTVYVTGDPGRDDRFTVDVEFTTERGLETLRWSIVDGTCGNGSLPLVPPRQLNTIDVPSDSHVRRTFEFRSVMVADATYHLNLYANGGDDFASVIGCANLKG